MQNISTIGSDPDPKEEPVRRPYAPPAVVYEGKITTRAGLSDPFEPDSEESVDPYAESDPFD